MYNVRMPALASKEGRSVYSAYGLSLNALICLFFSAIFYTQVHDYRKAAHESLSPDSTPSPKSGPELSSVRTTPKQTAIDTTATTWSPAATVQETELGTESRSKELTEPLLPPKERHLVVEDTSAEGSSSSSATALNMHDGNTHQ